MTTDRLTSGTDSAISDAIVALLGGEQDAALLGSSEVDVLAARALIVEALGVHAHWDTTSPVAAKAIVMGHMRRHHGELSDAALTALAVHCTRDFRC